MEGFADGRGTPSLRLNHGSEMICEIYLPDGRLVFPSNYKQRAINDLSLGFQPFMDYFYCNQIRGDARDEGPE